MKTGITVLCTLLIVGTWTGWSMAEQEPDHICFRKIDTDRNGTVTRSELAVYYGEDDKKFKSADGNADGVLTHDEYHGYLGHGRTEEEPIKKTE